MWTYRQKTGELVDATGRVAGVGYSGHGLGRNNPDDQGMHSVGPIPRGDWLIAEDPPPRPKIGAHGPYVMHLVPKSGTDTLGRGGFLIHGDSISLPGTASLGCIVMARPVRELIWESGDRDLRVVDGTPGTGPA